MKKLKFSRYFLFIAVFTLLATFVYVVQKSYDNLMKPIKDTTQNPILKPIDPNLDVSVLDQIQKREFFTENSP